MAASPLWPGYDDADEDELLAALESRVDATFDDDDPTTDEEVTRCLAQAIRKHEALKQRAGAAGYRERLHRRADEIADVDIGSWRPR